MNVRMKWNGMLIDAEEHLDDKVGQLDNVTYRRLKSLCQEIANILYENYNPHTEIVISIDDFTIKQDLVNGFLKEVN